MKKDLNYVLAVLVIVLSVIVIAMGVYIVTNKNGKEETGDNSVLQDNKYEVKVDNKSVDEVELNNLFDVLGIPSSNNEYGNSSLNDFVSNENYKENAENIIIYYGIKKKISVPDGYDLLNDEGMCGPPGCTLITKDDAESILKTYNFDGELKDYFYQSSVLNDVYGISHGGTLVLTKWNGPDAGIKHNVAAEYINGEDIKITDKQVVSYYDENDITGKVKKENKNVTYTFKKDNGSYYLSSVETN